MSLHSRNSQKPSRAFGGSDRNGARPNVPNRNGACKHVANRNGACPSVPNRNGRALVECIVAALLLSITGLSLAATARGTLAQADDAELIAKAQSLTTTRVEDALRANCTSAVNGRDQQPRVDLRWRQSAGARSTQLHADITLNRSPIGFAANADLLMTVESGGVCQ